MTNAELIAEIRKLAVELNGDTEGLPALSKLRKPALEQLLAGFQLSLRAQAEDEATAAHISAMADAGTPYSQDAIDDMMPSQDFALGDVPELEYDREVEATDELESDRELISFMRTVVEAPSLPTAFPITETDVAVAEVYVVVQLRGKLYNGKLISVVNRRTTLSPAFLVTVELEDGVRRLVRADHTLAA